MSIINYVSVLSIVSRNGNLNFYYDEIANFFILAVIGEAVKRMAGEFRAVHADIPWMLMAGMRDHLIYANDLIDWDEVWKTAVTDIPCLPG
jgi:uncharacterized protein with HEPN domain